MHINEFIAPSRRGRYRTHQPIMRIDKLLASSRRGRFTAPTSPFMGASARGGLALASRCTTSRAMNGLVGAVNRPLRTNIRYPGHDSLPHLLIQPFQVATEFRQVAAYQGQLDCLQQRLESLVRRLRLQWG